MASPDVLEFATLLEPIPGDDPAGMDLRTDSSPGSLYYLIKDARSAARAAERQMVSEGEESGRADWRPVVRHGLKATAERSKDLEVAAFMIEALVRLNGFAGLRDGFRLAREFVERFWDGLYPRPDEDGLETRLAPLISLNGEDAEGTLIAPIAQVPLTHGGDASYAAYHYQQALELAQVKDEEQRQRRLEQGAPSMPMFEKSVADTSAEFFVTLLADLTQCEQEFAALDQALQDRCGAQAPPTSNIRSALAACRDVITTVARHKLPAAGSEAPAEGEAGAEGAAGAGATEGGPPAVAGAVRSREDALQLLLKVADFFRRTEPHTPLSFALEQAVRWGRMSLPELLTELIEDETARNALFHRVGIRPPSEEGQES